MTVRWEGPDEIVVGIPGLAVIALNLDSRMRWPGLKVVEWKKAGRGHVCMIKAPPLAWKALVVHIEVGVGGTQGERTAVKRALSLVKEALA